MLPDPPIPSKILISLLSILKFFLAEIAVNDKEAFALIAEQAKSNLAA